MRIAVVNGFLGSGKTTFILNILKELGPRMRIAVLVNELGAVGIDGSLIKSQTTEVVELTNGCICCSLSPELKKQVIDIKGRYDPQILLIEPTGAASVTGVLQVLQAPGMEEYIESFGMLLIIDAERFFDLYRKNRYFTELQVKMSSLVLINKCDKVKYDTALLIKDAAAACNPAAHVLLTHSGRIYSEDWESFLRQESPYSPYPMVFFDGKTRIHNEKYQSFSWSFPGVVRRERLVDFLEGLSSGGYGTIVRAKGLVKTDEGWMRFDYLPVELFWEEIPEPQGGSRLFIVGEDLLTEKLTNALSTLQRIGEPFLDTVRHRT
jgi:G3E family GTPase